MIKEEEMDQQPADPTSEVRNTLISLKEEIVGLAAALKGAFQASQQTAHSDGKQQREKSAVSDGCCFYCGKKGHIKKKCRKRLKDEAQRQTEQQQRQASQQTAHSDGKQQREKSAVSGGCCFYCGKKGYIKKKCKKRLKSEAQRQTEQQQQQVSTNEERLPQGSVHGAANAARSDSPSTTNTT